MEARAKALEDERRQAEELMERARLEAESFAQEMNSVRLHQSSLQSELHQVMQEKEQARQAVLKEQQEREKLERKLQMAEEALRRLDAALRKSGIKVDVTVEVSCRVGQSLGKRNHRNPIDG